MLLPLLLSSVAVAQDAPRVLHLGNSYTFYNDLQLRVAESLRATVPALSAVEGARLTAGGLRLPNHVERVERGEAQWVDALTGPPGRWTWMVLQDQSQVPGFPESEPYWQDSAEAVTALDAFAVDQGAETVLFMTWGRRDGDSTNPTMFPDFETMNARLDAGYRAFSERASEDGRTLWVAPVGRAFGEVYTRVAAEGGTPEAAGTDFHRLYDGDGSHPSALGTALSASVFVRTLTGWSPRWETPPPGVDADDLPWLVAAADAAVEPFADLPYPWASLWADTVAPSDVGSELGWVASGTVACQTVGVDVSLDPVERATLGAAHGATAGCGRLWMLPGGAWTLGTVGTEDGAVGEVVVAGGALEVESLDVPAQVVDGALTVSATATQALTVSGGTLALSRGSDVRAVDVVQTGGVVELSAAAPAVLSGAAHLDGALQVVDFDDDRAVLLVAADVTLGDALTHDLPAGYGLAVEAGDDGDQLVAVADGSDGGGGDGAGSDDGGGDPAGTDDGGTDGAEAGGGSASAGSGAGGTPDKGGCMASGGAAGGLVLVLLGMGARRRAE